MEYAAFTLIAQAQDQPDPDSGAAGIISVVISLAILVLMIAGLWKIFEKAGQPGWASIIPIYNSYILLKVCNRPGWWLLLFLIPLVSLIIAIIVMNDLSKSFGHGIGYTLGLFFLPFIFIPLLGFGDSQYRPLRYGGKPAGTLDY